MPISFYSVREPYGEFSNFSAHAIELDGLLWKTTEHYFQAQKFDDPDYRERIRLSPSPKEAADLGRSRSVPLRPDWETIKETVMYRAVKQKFSTHTALQVLLLSTGEEAILEAAPGDHYWGTGQDGTGKNRLGILLMQVREELRRGQP